MLDKYGYSNNLWGWNDFYFWGQESDKTGSRKRILRGWLGARNWVAVSNNTAAEHIGFRSVLEIPPPVTKVIAIAGTLADFDGYDLVLTNTGPLPHSCSWAIRRGKNTIINRVAIAFL